MIKVHVQDFSISLILNHKQLILNILCWVLKEGDLKFSGIKLQDSKNFVWSLDWFKNIYFKFEFPDPNITLRLHYYAYFINSAKNCLWKKYHTRLGIAISLEHVSTTHPMCSLIDTGRNLGCNNRQQCTCRWNKFSLATTLLKHLILNNTLQ